LGKKLDKNFIQDIKKEIITKNPIFAYSRFCPYLFSGGGFGAGDSGINFAGAKH
jgi:hypothetical protein